MSDWLLIDGARRLLGDACTYEAVQAAEQHGWSSPIWDAVARRGYGSLSELPLEDALAILTVAGEHAAPVPLCGGGARGLATGEPAVRNRERCSRRRSAPRARAIEW